MLVITGTQRSGTSVIAKCFIAMGYDLGSRLWDEVALGGYENEVICAFYRDYLGDPRFPFDDYELPTFHDGGKLAFSELDFDVVKFSYLCMNPVFVSIWHKFRPPEIGDRFLIMHRDPDFVMLSKVRLKERFQHDSLLLPRASHAISHAYANSLRLLQGFGYNGYIVDFPQCLDRLDQVNVALDILGAQQIRKDVWTATVDKSKVHFKEVT